MGESDAATVTYIRQEGLEAGAVMCGWQDGDISEIYEQYKAIRSGRLMIIGPPGSGKTLAAITLVIEILSSGLASPDQRMMPIPVSIGGWDGAQGLGEWLSDRLVEGYRIARPVARGLVYGDYILPVLDGLDEADDQVDRSVTAAQKILEQIRSSSDASDIAHGALVMTCRSDFYEDLYESGHSLRNAAVVEMKDLEPDSIRSYMLMRFKDDPAHNPDRSDSFAAAIRRDDSCLIRTLNRPLMLALAILILKADYSTPQQFALYRRASSLRDHLFRRFLPATVRAYPRSPLPRIAGGVRRRTLPWFRSAPSYYDADLVHRWLLRIATSRRSGQLRPVVIQPGQLWCLANVKTTMRIHTIAALISGLVAAGLAGELVAGAPGYIVIGIAGTAAIGLALWAGMLQRPEPRSLSFRQFATSAGLLRFAVIIILGGFCALGGELDGGWETAITSGVGGTITFAVIVGLVGGIAEIVDPRWILRNDLLFGSLAALGGSVAAALPGGLNGGVDASLKLNKYLTIPGSACLAIIIVVPAGILLGSRCWSRHVIMVLLLAPKQAVPWRVMHFVRWCYIANLLKISGTGYELRHQEMIQSLESYIGRQTLE